MATFSCPKCGEYNSQGVPYCAACGTALQQDSAKPTTSRLGDWMDFIQDNTKKVLGIVVGIMIILSGIYFPGLASLIIQTVLIFTADNHYQRQVLRDAQPSDSDGWWVIASGGIIILFYSFDLYATWKSRKGGKNASVELAGNDVQSNSIGRGSSG